jgi:hypothetical protein
MGKRKRSLVVVVATRYPGVIPALETAAASREGVRIERREALSLDGAYRALRGAHLIVVDPDHLAPGPADLPPAALEAALNSDSLVAVDGVTFAGDAAGILELAVAQTGLGAMLPPRRVAFTALAGGVGCTSLALATAAAFHRATGLPAAVIELTPGPPALLPATGVTGADVYQALTQGAAYPVWRGVTLAPMAWETARLLPPGQLQQAWEAVAARHIYTAYDAPAWHPLWEQVVVDRALVLADQRGAAQSAALALAARLRGEGWDVVLGLNRAGVAGAVALTEKPGFALKAVRDPLRLGPPVLRAIYPGWSGR